MGWAEGPSLQAADVESRAVLAVLAVLAATRTVCDSIVSLELRVRAMAGELAGAAVGLARIREVRHAVQQAKGLGIEVSGITVIPIGHPRAVPGVPGPLGSLGAPGAPGQGGSDAPWPGGLPGDEVTAGGHTDT